MKIVSEVRSGAPTRGLKVLKPVVHLKEEKEEVLSISCVYNGSTGDVKLKSQTFSEQMADVIECYKKEKERLTVRPNSDLCCYNPNNQSLSFNPWSHVVLRPIMYVMNETRNVAKLNAEVSSLLPTAQALLIKHLYEDGILCSSLHCPNHSEERLTLGICMNISEPESRLSGCLCLLSACCPSDPISVFSHSIFQTINSTNGPLQPHRVLAIICEWAKGKTVCQAQKAVQNMPTQTIYYVYLLLRSLCLLGVQHLPLLGGPNEQVELVFARLDDSERYWIFAALDRIGGCVRAQICRSCKNADPIVRYSSTLALHQWLLKWVHDKSLLCIDDSITISMLEELNFNNYVKPKSLSDPYSNRHVRYYVSQLREKIENVMAISELRVEELQLLISEILWREHYGSNCKEAYDNIMIAIREQTQFVTPTGIVMRLNKIINEPCTFWVDELL